MRRLLLGLAILTSAALAQDGPYQVLKTAKTGGLGGFDYIYADEAGRRLYFAVEQDLKTMPGAKALTFDTKTNRILTDAAEYGPAPEPVPGAPARRGPARGPMIPGSSSILVVGH
jgi:hypothetical protein